MTYADLLHELTEICADSYDHAAPAGLVRFVVIHEYAETSFYGSDSNVLDVLRVQIDVYTQARDDALPGTVKALLRANCCPYTVQYSGWDDDTARFRTILQTEVL